MLLLAASAIATDVLRLGMPSHTALVVVVLAILGDVGIGLLASAGDHGAVAARSV